MQAIMRDMVDLAGYGAAAPPVIDLRLARLRVPPAWRPALLTALRVAMGIGLGAAFGAAAGHGGFWAVIGTGLGAALAAIARRG